MAGSHLGRVAEIAGTLDVDLHGSRRMSEAFVPLLDEADGRVVNIASASGPMFVNGCPDPAFAALLSDPAQMPATFEDLQAKIDAAFPPGVPDYDGASYGLSKACLTVYTVQLARRFPNLKINAVTPGFINTDITRGVRAFYVHSFVRSFVRSIDPWIGGGRHVCASI